MIEKQSAQSGDTVFRIDGRLLASAYAPKAEAASWLARRKILLADVKTVFVLGAGSGYHIAALDAAFPGRIVVIDRSQELVSAVKSLFSFRPGKIQFEVAEKAQSLRSIDSIRDAVKHSFLVLAHPPTAACAPEFFNECEKLLTGRDWGSLTWQWKLKGHTDLDSNARIGAGNEKLTIYDLEKTKLVQNSEDRERMLVKALRELVK